MRSKVMRRVIALAAATAMTFSMMALPVYAEEASDETENVESTAAIGEENSTAAGEEDVSSEELEADSDALSYDSFTDLMDPDSEWNWYYDGVSYVIEQGYMIGISDSIFAPDEPTTRAMVVTILYRMASEVIDMEALGEMVSTFTDIDVDSWYADAVVWAEDNQIALGYGAAIFGVNDEVTREQFATFLYRYASFMDYDTSAAADLSAYPDEKDVSSWSEAAISWAVANDIIRGEEINGVTYLAPEDSCTRAMTAEIIYRFAVFAGSADAEEGAEAEDAESEDSAESEEESKADEEAAEEVEPEENGESTEDAESEGYLESEDSTDAEEDAADSDASEEDGGEGSGSDTLEDGTYYFLQISEGEDGNILYTIYACTIEGGVAGEAVEIVSTTDPVGTMNSWLEELNLEEYASEIQAELEEALDEVENIAAVTLGNGAVYFLDSEGNLLYTFELNR